jgi:osmotically-inducible protein OsmY
MKKNTLLKAHFILAGATLALLTGCVPVAVVGVMGGATGVATSAAEERGIGGVISDADLKRQVRNRIEEINPNADAKVGVIVRQGRVLLTGTVETQKLQIDAVRAAWEVHGVREVIDEIRLGSEPGAGQTAKDSWISTQIKTKLLVGKNIASINYEFTTHNGVVYLIGIAQNPQELDEVLHIIRNVDGVKQVISHVTIKDQLADYYAQPGSAPAASVYGTPQHSPYSSPSDSLQQPNNESAFN